MNPTTIERAPKTEMPAMIEIPYDEYRSAIRTMPLAWSLKLTLGLVTIDVRSNKGYLKDKVTMLYYEFDLSKLKKIMFAIFALNDADCKIQRQCINNEANYLPVTDSAFLWNNFEFDWTDLTKINLFLKSRN